METTLEKTNRASKLAQKTMNPERVTKKRGKYGSYAKKTHRKICYKKPAKNEKKGQTIKKQGRTKTKKRDEARTYPPLS